MAKRVFASAAKVGPAETIERIVTSPLRRILSRCDTCFESRALAAKGVRHLDPDRHQRMGHSLDNAPIVSMRDRDQIFTMTTTTLLVMPILIPNT